MTYNDFERELYNCQTLLEVVRLCVDNNELSKKFVERQDWLRHMEYEHDFKGMNKVSVKRIKASENFTNDLKQAMKI